MRLEGRLDSNKYQQMLATSVPESVEKLKLKRGWISQQDNDPKHASKSGTQHLGLEWPLLAPDYRIQLYVFWGKIIICFFALHARRPSNISELEGSCKEEWGKIS